MTKNKIFMAAAILVLALSLIGVAACKGASSKEPLESIAFLDQGGQTLCTIATADLASSVSAYEELGGLSNVYTWNAIVHSEEGDREVTLIRDGKLEAEAIRGLLAQRVAEIEIFPATYYTRLICGKDRYKAVRNEIPASIVPASKTYHDFNGYYADIGGTEIKLTDEKGSFLTKWSYEMASLEIYPIFSAQTLGVVVDYAGTDFSQADAEAGRGTLSGEITAPVGIKIGADLNFLLRGISRDGFDFGGWYSGDYKVTGKDLSFEPGADKLNEFFEFSEVEGKTCVVLTAHWTRKQYDITFKRMISETESEVLTTVKGVYGRAVPFSLSETEKYCSVVWTDERGETCGEATVVTKAAVYFAKTQSHMKMVDGKLLKIEECEDTECHNCKKKVAHTIAHLFEEEYVYGETRTCVRCGAVNVNDILYTIAYDANKPAAASANVEGAMENAVLFYTTEGGLRENAYTLKGWSFVGWSDSATGAVKYQDGATVKGLSATHGSVVRLYAVWEAIEFSVALNVNDESKDGQSLKFSPLLSSEIVFVSYDGTTALEIPTNDLSKYYTFEGYFTEPSGGIKITNADGTPSAGKWQYPSKQTLYAHWSKVYDGYAYVSTRKDLQNVSTNLQGKYMLTNDIDLSSSEWTPLALNRNGGFAGEFDGNYNRIIGLNRTTKLTVVDSVGVFGLFGNLAKNALVQRIKFESVNLDIATESIGGSYLLIGVVAGRSVQATVKECSIEGKIKAGSKVDDEMRMEIGGIIGESVGSVIERCANRASVTAKHRACFGGGIVGMAINDDKGRSRVSDCYNVGDIKIGGGWWLFGFSAGAGGILGTLINTNEAIEINNCYVCCKIKCVNGYYRDIGGIAATAQNETNKTTINNNHYCIKVEFNEDDDYADGGKYEIGGNSKKPGNAISETDLRSGNNVLYGDNWIYSAGLLPKLNWE